VRNPKSTPLIVSSSFTLYIVYVWLLWHIILSLSIMPSSADEKRGYHFSFHFHKSFVQRSKGKSTSFYKSTKRTDEGAHSPFLCRSLGPLCPYQHYLSQWLLCDITTMIMRSVQKTIIYLSPSHVHIRSFKVKLTI